MTNAIPEQPNAGNGSQPQSFADPALAQQPSSVFDMSQYFDADIEGVEGMNARAPGGTSLTVVDDTMRTGNPSGLERMIFTALSDGSPAVAFYDDMGQAQVMRVTENQWLTMLNQRDDNRRELQFRMDADERRGELAAQWNNLVSTGDLSDHQNASLSFLWEVSPDEAVKQFAAMQAGNAERRMMTEVVGGVEMFGEDGWKELVASAEQVGIPLPMMESHYQLVQFAKAVEEARRQEAKDKRTQYEMHRGEAVPRTSMPWLGVTEALSYGRRMLWHAGLNSTLAQQGQASQAEHQQSLTDLQTMIRSHEMMSAPDMTLAQSLNLPGQARTASDNGRTLATGLYLMGAWEGVSFEYKPDGSIDTSSEHNAEQTQRVIDSLNTMSRQMGWVDMGTTDADGNTVYTKEENDLIDAVINKGRDHYGKAPRGYTEYVAEQVHQATLDRADEIRQEERDAQREWYKRIDEAKLKVITGGGDFSAEQLAELERMRRQGPEGDPLAGLNVGPRDVERTVHTGEGATNWTPGPTETVTDKATDTELDDQFITDVQEILAKDEKSVAVVARTLGLDPDVSVDSAQIARVLLEVLAPQDEGDDSLEGTIANDLFNKLLMAARDGEIDGRTSHRIRTLSQEYMAYRDRRDRRSPAP
tara:strand:- start:723 stop:2654 length:1932 start_codon:yes stop_codon:yes gene_type:complete